MLKSFLNLLGDFAKSSGQKRNENLHNILPLQVLLLLIKFISVELMKICGIFVFFKLHFVCMQCFRLSCNCQICFDKTGPELYHILAISEAHLVVML